MNPPTSSAVASDAGGLTALIRQQSADEVAQLQSDARGHVERLRAAAAAEVDALREAAEREGQDRGRREAAALLAVAEVQSRLMLLRAREAHIDAALAEARNRLAHLAALPDAAAIVAAFIRDALQVLPPGPVRVLLPDSHAAVLDEATRRQLGAGRWALRFESTAVPGGGVIVESEDGRLHFDNSIDARLRRRTAQLRHLAAGLLWPPDKESTP